MEPGYQGCFSQEPELLVSHWSVDDRWFSVPDLLVPQSALARTSTVTGADSVAIMGLP